jgi:electron transport complex protein RnfE
MPPTEPGQAYAEFVKGIWKENPIFVQVLGMCPMLAVTNSAVNALAMGIATARSGAAITTATCAKRCWTPPSS